MSDPSEHKWTYPQQRLRDACIDHLRRAIEAEHEAKRERERAGLQHSRVSELRGAMEGLGVPRAALAEVFRQVTAEQQVPF